MMPPLHSPNKSTSHGESALRKFVCLRVCRSSSDDTVAEQLEVVDTKLIPTEAPQPLAVLSLVIQEASGQLVPEAPQSLLVETLIQAAKLLQVAELGLLALVRLPLTQLIRSERDG